MIKKSRKWEKLNPYCMASGEWRVTKSFVDGCTLYSVWRGKESNATGYVNSFDEAKALIDEHEKWIADYEREEAKQ